GGLLLVLGVAAFTLLDRGLRESVDASLRSVAIAIADSSRETASGGASLEAMLDAMLGPGAGNLFALLDRRGPPDPRLGPRNRIALPLSTTAVRNAEVGRETLETIELPGARAPVRLLTWPVVSGGRLEQLVQVTAPLDEVEAARRRFLLILAGLA